MVTAESFFYTESFREYYCSRFGLFDSSYSRETNGACFDAVILHCNGNVGNIQLSYLPLPLYNGNDSSKKLKLYMKEYIGTITSYGDKRIAIRQDPVMSYSDTIIRCMLDAGFSPAMFYTTIVDLTKNESLLWQNIRSSYHSLIHKKENDDVRLCIIDSENNNDKLIQWFVLYSELIGRGGKVLDSTTQAAIEHSVMQNNTVIYLLHRKDTLLAGAQFDKGSRFAYYTASGIKPEFEHTEPFTHFIMWKAILDLKQRGVEKLEIGPVFFNSVHNFYHHSEKEMSISQFKLGFGGKLTPFNIFIKESIKGG